MVVCTYPKLFAAYHVLLRLSVPRHPPYALSNLTNYLYLQQAALGSILSHLFLDTFQLSKNKISFKMLKRSTPKLQKRNVFHVGLTGIEPVTSRLSGVRSNQLSYRPKVNRISSVIKASVLATCFTQAKK